MSFITALIQSFYGLHGYNQVPLCVKFLRGLGNFFQKFPKRIPSCPLKVRLARYG